jgi:hypothetical protein
MGKRNGRRIKSPEAKPLRDSNGRERKSGKPDNSSPSNYNERNSDNPTVWFARNSSVEMFLTSLEHNQKLQQDSKKLYRLAIDNAIRNQNLLPLLVVRKYCMKIPDNSIRYAEITKNEYIINYLKSNRWLTSLGGF